MKRRIIAIVLNTVLICSLVACNIADNPDSTDETKTTHSSTEPTETTIGVGEEVERDGYTVCVNGIDTFKNEKNNYVIVEITIKNTSSEPLKINISSDIKLYLDNERATYVSDPNVSDEIINHNLFLSDTTIDSTRQVTGYVAYKYYKPFNDIEVECPNVVVHANTEDIGEELAPTSTPIPTETTEAIEIATTEETITDTPTATTTSPNGTPEDASDMIPIVFDGEYGIFHNEFYKPECNVPLYLYPSWARFDEMDPVKPCPYCFPNYYLEHPEAELPEMRPPLDEQ